MRKLALLALLAILPSPAQMTAFNKDMLLKYTAQWKGDRFPDGRPKVADEWLRRLQPASSEETWGDMRSAGYTNQWEGGWQILQPQKKLIGRAVTAQFMPVRPDVNEVINADAKAAGMGQSQNQRVIDMLQPGDVIVVDLFGKVENGTFVGDNLAFAVYTFTKTGIVIDGAIRDREGIQPMGMPAYVRGFHPSAIGNVMLTGVNVPIRVGNVTVMPGDIVFGDNEGLSFIPPHLVQRVVERSEVTQLHDVWTKEKLKTGKYKSSEIYSTPRDPALRKEYEDWLAKEKAQRGIK